MTTRILKFKYANKSSKDKFVADIVFAGGKVDETTILSSAKLIYFNITEGDNSFMRKFRETRSNKFLLN